MSSDAFKMERGGSNVNVLMPNNEQSAATDPPSDGPTWRNSYPQIVGAYIVHLLTIQAGINMAFSAILLPQLNHPQSDLHLQKGEGPWIASLVTISLPIGSLLSGRIMDRFGRRNVSLFVCIPYLVSWILIYWSYNVVWLYVGRVVAGAASGISSVAIFYTSETTNPVWRPMLLGLNSVFVSLGILLTSIFGACFHWRTVAAIFAVLTAVIFSFITVLPESPHWLLQFGNGTRDIHRVAEARKSLRWFNRIESQAERELNQLLNTYRSRSSASPLQKETLKEKWEGLKKPEIYKPIALLLVIFFFQQTSGSYVIIFYAVELFKELDVNFGFLNEYSAMIVMAVVRLVVAVVAMILARRYGRRTLCIVSGIGMGITMISASASIQFSQFENKLLTLILVLLFVCFGAIGWQIIPWSLTGELLPTRVRAIVGGILISYTYLIMFVVVQTFPYLTGLIYTKGVFLLFSISSLAGTLFVWKFLPETYGKTLAEIERAFK